MGLQPKLIKEKSFTLKKCACCGGTYGADNYAPTKSFFYPDGALPFCDACVEELISKDEGDWAIVNRLCQYVDIPFIPTEWEKITSLNNVNPFHKYAELFMEAQYDDTTWGEYYNKYKTLKAAGHMDDELPLLNDAQRKKYRERWGQYDDDGYQYLENLYSGLLQTQSVNGALQMDQAVKLCKISYEIDKRIEEGSDIDKLLSSYDKLVKAAEFTPKNVKNVNDFESIGEVVKWMEKRGWRNNFYDDVTRDIVDETIKSMQNFNQRLYTQEVSIGDEITRRIEALKTAQQIENDGYYGTADVRADDNYENDVYNELFDIEEEFELGEDDE